VEQLAGIYEAEKGVLQKSGGGEDFMIYKIQ